MNAHPTAPLDPQARLDPAGCPDPEARFAASRSAPGRRGPTDAAARESPAIRRWAGAAAMSAATLLSLGGCASVDPTTYASEKPTLDLTRYFDGDLDAWGIFQDRSGKVVKRFTVRMKGTWNGDVGTLDEDFVYSDGTRQKRVWTLRRLPGDRWVGTAPDVVGEARGIVSGNALNWQYTLALDVDGRTWHVDFDDWMFLVDDRVMLNRAVMSKFGIRLGEVTLSFTKR